MPITSSTYRVGLLVRGRFRRAAFALGLRIEEEGGFFESVIRVSGSEQAIRILSDRITAFKKRREA